ncbi:MAG: class I SAM-dependent methyltransferase [Longimicrobiales bacterium]
MRSACPYCGSAQQKHGPERPTFRYAECARCGSGYVVSEPIDFRAFYQEYDPALVRETSPLLRARYLEMITKLTALTPGRRMLEVGCGNGHFLTVARESGWLVWGTELSGAHVERARRRGLHVVYGDLVEEPLFRDLQFDAVVAMEVIEHLPEPTRFLEAAAARLVPGGMVFLTTPNFGSVTRRILGSEWSVLGVEHVALASPRGLAAALRAAGFEVVRLRSKSLYLGEYRRALRRRPDEGGIPLAAENAELTGRIEASRLLSAMKTVANGMLGATGLGEALECVARLEPRGS